jgi:hypothetical protein
VTQGSVLGLLLHLLHTADQLTTPESTTTTFADCAEILATDSDSAIVSQKLQANIAAIQNWLKSGE